jgi:aerobic carbon-monoxide dehydrogenase large subunit
MTTIQGSILGHPVVRKEDPALVAGARPYTADVALEGALEVAFVRSTVAHATITSVDTADAAAMPGVVTVLTAENLGLPPVPGFVMLPQFGRAPLAAGTVRFVGECVACVVAETKAQALDAAEAVLVEYEPLQAVVDVAAAVADGAPLLFPETGTNVALALPAEDDPDLLADADVVVTGRFVNQRIAVMPMEGNAIAAAPRPDGGLDVWVSTQTPHGVRDGIAGVVGLEAPQVRVIAPAVGGGFGAKIGPTAEHYVVAKAALLTGRPVRWSDTRSENLQSMTHGRGQVQDVQLGVNRDGSLVGLKVKVAAEAGAYPAMGAFLPFMTRQMAQGTYRIPKVQFEMQSVATNTTPVAAFRGAGRPEATALIERIMDVAAHEIGMDPAEFRRINLIPADAFPFTTVTGAALDVGDYPKALAKALEIAGYDDLRAEQAKRRESGDRTLLGIGVATYVEVTAALAKEWGSVTIEADGGATVRIGTASHGQGHDTTFSMLVNDRLGIPLDQVRVIHSDTSEVPTGHGTMGSRSLQVGGTAVVQASEGVLDKAKRIAAQLLEAGVDDIVVADGKVGVAGVPARALSWAELAVAAQDPANLAEGDEPGLAFEGEFDQGASSYPFGAHVSVVEVDADTGGTTLLRHVAVDDCGRIVNPLLVRGQQHGGIAQGIAQAVYEGIVYDDEGNLLTGTLMDYAMPAASELPSFEAVNTETPTHLNPLGAKGIGESGTIGATPSVQSAVIDALAHLGVRHLDMPLSPQRVWAAIRDAEG